MAILTHKQNGQGLIETCLLATLALGTWLLCWRIAAQDFYYTVAKGHAVMSARLALGGTPPASALHTVTTSSSQKARAVSLRGQTVGTYQINLPQGASSSKAPSSFFW